MYGASNYGCDGYEGVDFLTFISKVIFSRSYFNVFMIGGYQWCQFVINSTY